jgi:hypothetical protein
MKLLPNLLLEFVTGQNSAASNVAVDDPSLPSQFEVKRVLGLPRVSMLPVADVLHVHPVFFRRQNQYEQGSVPDMAVQLDNVAYLGSGSDRAENEVSDVYYGQVIAMGTIRSNVAGVAQVHDFLVIRNYTCPLALSELRLQATSGGPRTDVPQLDDRGFPLTMRPLVWEPAEPSTSRGRSVGFAPGKYSVISPDMLLQQVCIVKDYKRGEGNFLVNDLVHWPSKDNNNNNNQSL